MNFFLDLFQDKNFSKNIIWGEICKCEVDVYQKIISYLVSGEIYFFFRLSEEIKGIQSMGFRKYNILDLNSQICVSIRIL